MIDGLVRFLVCPYCERGLSTDGRALRCDGGHAFDIARQGYVCLLPPGARPDGGDTAAMVQARAAFLAAGHFSGLAAELARAVRDAVGSVDGEGCVVDAGAGTGYYLAAVLDQLPDRAGLALDLSKFALRRAARAHPCIGAVACDVWGRFPVAAGAAVAVLNVFAPRNGRELARILHPQGGLFVVTPDPGHLSELRAALGLLSIDERQEERLTEKLSPTFNLAARASYRATLSLHRDHLRAIVAMGPSAWHVEPAGLERRIQALSDPTPATVAVTVSRFRPNSDAGRVLRDGVADPRL